MKKLVLAMACVLSLALLASCKQAASTQDVNLKNQAASEAGSYKGTVTLTADAGSYSAATWTSTASTTDGFLVGPNYATISWDKNRDNVGTNYKSFTLTFDVFYATDTAATSNGSSYTSTSISFDKVGDDYYYYTTVGTANGAKKVLNKLELVDGDPASGSFTLKGWGQISLDSQTANVSQIKFEVK